MTQFWQFARCVYALLALSVYAVSVGGLYMLMTQTHHYVLWGAMLITAPVVMLLLLLINIVVQWMRDIAAADHQHSLQDFCRWYCAACDEVRLSTAIYAICMWLIRIHIVSAVVALCIIPLYYMADADMNFAYISGALLVYVVLLLGCAILRRMYAPQPLLASG